MQSLGSAQLEVEDIMPRGCLQDPSCPCYSDIGLDRNTCVCESIDTDIGVAVLANKTRSIWELPKMRAPNTDSMYHDPYCKRLPQKGPLIFGNPHMEVKQQDGILRGH